MPSYLYTFTYLCDRITNMKSFIQFCNESFRIDEKLITFGNQAYPKFGQVVIVAGGSASGKGHILDNLLGIEGNVLDVDALKALAIGSTRLAAKIKDETGIDIKNLSLRNGEDVKTLHDVLADVYGITKANQQRVFSGILAAPEDRKPNLIFDVTLKDMQKLDGVTRNAQKLGYDKKNIHVVWVLNDIELAQQQNRERDRVVPSDILLSTHEGVAITMARIMDMGSDLEQYLDGDMYIAFNKRGTDTDMATSSNGGKYVIDANYLQIKKQGSSVMSRAKLSTEVRSKIADYTPRTPGW